jgi:hypothetical protein
VLGVPEESAQRDWRFRQLKWSLQALAAAGAAQQELFPEQASTADDLAFAFDHWLTVVRDEHGSDLSPAELDALSAIERKLATMSKDGAEFDLELWTDGALRTSEHWAEVRALAQTALEVVEDTTSVAPQRGE